MTMWPNKSPEPPLALSVPLSRFTSRVGGGSAFFVRRLTHHKNMKPLKTGLIIGILHSALYWASYGIVWWMSGSDASIVRRGASGLMETLCFPISALLGFRPVLSVLEKLPEVLVISLDSCIWGLCAAALVYGFRRKHHEPVA